MIVIKFKYILKYPMKKTLFGLAALLMSLHAGLPVYAQKSINVTIHENGTERQDTIDLPLSMTYPLDSLLNDWKAKNYINPAKDCQTSQENPQFSDSVYIDRLARIPAVMEMPYNDIVRRFIDQYTGRLRTQVSFMLSACNFYMPIFEQALDAYNLPLELKYLPIIESALNPSAMSRAGASGLWQFMLRTGKLYGLESNSLVDERRDPIKSTWAAARYLKDMYDIYKDWNLVIAAYNCGPGNVNKAIRRAGGKTDYWEIYNFLPRETRGYVPAFIAANYVMTYYCKHNICPMETNIPEVTDTGHTKPQTLRLPLDAISSFIDNQDTIYAHRQQELFKNRRLVAVSDTRPRAVAGKGKPTIYKIRRGDTLGQIAERFHVRTNDIRLWNGIVGNRITAGKTLKIYNN